MIAVIAGTRLVIVEKLIDGARPVGVSLHSAILVIVVFVERFDDPQIAFEYCTICRNEICWFFAGLEDINQ